MNRLLNLCATDMNDISNFAASCVLLLFFVIFLVIDFYLEDVKMCRSNPLIFNGLTGVNIIEQGFPNIFAS